MPRFHLISFAAATMFVLAGVNLAYGVDIKPDARSAIAPTSDAVLVRGGVRGGGHGGFHGAAGHRGGAVAVRGPHGGGAVAVHGARGGVVHGGRVVGGGRYHGGAVVAGRPRVGGRYGGGVWYGTGRRYWGGRWWPYGVGSCWLMTDIGYVWTCQ